MLSISTSIHSRLASLHCLLFSSSSAFFFSLLRPLFLLRLQQLRLNLEQRFRFPPSRIGFGGSLQRCNLCNLPLSGAKTHSSTSTICGHKFHLHCFADLQLFTHRIWKCPVCQCPQPPTRQQQHYLHQQQQHQQQKSIPAENIYSQAMRYSNQQSTHAEPTTSPYKSSSSMAESLHQAAAAHGFDLTPYIGSSTFYDSSDASDSSIERLQSSSKTSPSLIPNWKSFSNGYFNAQTLPDGILDKKSGTSSYASFDSSLPTQVAPATYLPAEPQNAFRAKLYQGILSKKKISDSRRSNGPSITPFTCLDGFLETRQKPNGNGLLQNNIPRSPSFDKSESNSAVNMPNSFSSSSSSVLPLQQDMFFRSVNEIAGMGMHSVSSICRSVFSDENLQGNNRKRLLNFSNSKKEVDSSIKVPRMWDSYQGLASSTSGSMSSDEKIVKWYKITVQKVADTYFLKSEEALHQQQRMITQMNDTDPIEINESSDSLMEPLKNDLEMKLHNPQPISTDICSKAHSIFDDEPLDLTMSASASCEIESVIKSPDIDTYDNPEPFEVDSESLKEPIVDLVDNEVIGYSDDTKVPRSRRECRKGPGANIHLKCTQ